MPTGLGLQAAPAGPLLAPQLHRIKRRAIGTDRETSEIDLFGHLLSAIGHMLHDRLAEVGGFAEQTGTFQSGVRSRETGGSSIGIHL